MSPPDRATRVRLLEFAMPVEQIASGSAHIDNIAPSLYGSLFQ